MSTLAQADLKAQLSQLATDAASLDAAIERYWTQEGVSQLEIFIDPELFKYIQRWYVESRAFAQRVVGLQTTVSQL